MTYWREAEATGTKQVDATAAVHKTAFVDYSGGLIIGAHVIISAHVMVYTHDHQFGVKGWRSLPSVYKHKIIHEGVFIGPYAFLTMNCTAIGAHSVIGSHSVVTCDIPPFEIWAGNPARKLGEVIQ